MIFYGLEHSTMIGWRATDAVLQAVGEDDTLGPLLYVAAASFGNIGLAIREDEADRRARQPPHNDEDWW